MLVGYFFQAGHLQAGALLDDLNEGGGFGEGVVGAGVQPGEAAAQGLDLELAIGQKILVHGGDFQFSAGAGLDMLGHFHHLVGVEVEAHDGVVALGLLGLFLNGEAVAVLVKLGHAVTLRV